MSRPRPDVVTSAGLGVWYAEPHRTPVCPRDLRVHLRNLRRYVGAIDVPILTHLALCVRIAEAWRLSDDLVALAGAHDLHEAYVGDLPPRLKDLLPGWRELERRWEDWVHRCLGLALPAPESVEARVLKEVDVAALYAEMQGWSHPGLRNIEGDVVVRQILLDRPEWRTGTVRAWADLPAAEPAQWSILEKRIPALQRAENLLFASSVR